MLQDSCEILKGKLYFLSSSKTYYPTSDIIIINIDNEYTYEGYYRDFGPLNISCICKYGQKLNKKLKLYAPTQKKIVHLTTTIAKKKVNAAFLMGSFLISYMKFSPQEAYRSLCQTDIRYISFRDASIGKSSFQLTLVNCLKGFHKAIATKILKIRLFNVSEYDHYNMIGNGDVHWIIPKKILAFTGPTINMQKFFGSVYHSPSLYLSIFHKWRVSAVVRLNAAEYDKEIFTNAGIEHFDLVFADGGVPSDKIVHKFLQIIDESNGAVAVHCRAGLGRTGTLIGCYLMKQYHFNAGEAIAWIRICRPGSIIGIQQNWLIEHQSFCWRLGNHIPIQIKRTFSNKSGDQSTKAIYTKRNESLRLTDSIYQDPELPVLQSEVVKNVKIFDNNVSKPIDKVELQNTESIPDILYDYEYFPRYGRKHLYESQRTNRSLIRSLDGATTDDFQQNIWLERDNSYERTNKDINHWTGDHKNSLIIPSYNVVLGRIQNAVQELSP